MADTNFKILKDKLNFIIDDAHIIAEDDDGRKYDYEREGFPELKPDIRAMDWLNIAPDYD